MKRRAVVVDLDGTLLSTNTFKDYVLFVAKESVAALRVDVTIGVAFFVALRLMRVVSHSTMKYYLLKVTVRFMGADRLSRLAEMLLLKANQDVTALCEDYRRQGCYVLLATAAPESYAGILSSRMGMDGCCATPMPRHGLQWKENVREQKREAVLQHLEPANASIAVVITDHHDDIPLMSSNPGKNLLVNPSPKTISLVRVHGIQFESIHFFKNSLS